MKNTANPLTTVLKVAYGKPMLMVIPPAKKVRKADCAGQLDRIAPQRRRLLELRPPRQQQREIVHRLRISRLKRDRPPPRLLGVVEPGKLSARV